MTSPIAIQLYSLRDAIGTNMTTVFEQLAEIGFVGAEPFGGMDHATAAPLLKTLGFEVYSIHSELPLGEATSRVLTNAEAYGVKELVYPWHAVEAFTTIDGIKQLADTLNAAAKVAQENGLQLAYHNHDFEFVMVEDQVAFDVFVEHLDPSINLEIDTYWVHVGGQDPVTVIKRLAERAPLLHMKDGPGNREDAMLALGTGVMDFPAIVEAAGDHAKWMIVELDRCDTDMMAAVEQSYHYLTEAGLAHGR